jgi:hypothetical protein
VCESEQKKEKARQAETYPTSQEPSQFGSSVGIKGYPSTGNDEREAVSRLDGCETAIRVPVLLVYRSIVGAHILVGGGRIRIRRWVTDKRGRVGPRVGTRM